MATISPVGQIEAELDRYNSLLIPLDLSDTDMNAHLQTDASRLALDESELRRSAALYEKIVSMIRESASQRLPFSTFMNLALYDPQLGYYTAADNVVGAAGDFVTAPEIGSAFGTCIAEKISKIAAQFPQDISIFEFGAGSGKLAVHILEALNRIGIGIARYSIFEVSPRLSAIQRDTLKTQAPWARHIVNWQTSIEDLQIDGIIIANELLDAIPFELFSYEDRAFHQGFVEESDGRLGIAYSDRLTPDFSQYSKRIPITSRLSGAYRSELHCQALAWMRSLLEKLQHGSMLIIDYGFPEYEYYHPHRDTGTLSCHRRHHVHGDPLAYLGCQDISAHINFTALAQAATRSGATVNGFSTLAGFLLDTGILDACGYSSDARSASERNRELLTLTSPSEMGDLFKVMELTKGIDGTPDGFRIVDHSHRLTTSTA